MQRALGLMALRKGQRLRNLRARHVALRALGKARVALATHAILAVQGARAVMVRAERVEREARKGEKE